jgi:hypothetical protein
MDDLDLVGELTAQDDDGLGWSILADAIAPDRVRPGAMLLAGDGQARAVVGIVAVDDDGQIHFTVLPGSVAKNRHFLDRTVASGRSTPATLTTGGAGESGFGHETERRPGSQQHPGSSGRAREGSALRVPELE